MTHERNSFALWDYHDGFHGCADCPRPRSARFCLRSAAMVTDVLGPLWKMNRPLAIGIVRARQVRREQRLSENEACVAAWATRCRFQASLKYLEASLSIQEIP